MGGLQPEISWGSQLPHSDKLWGWTKLGSNPDSTACLLGDVGKLLSLTKTQCPQGGPHLAGSWKSEGNKVCKSLSTVSGLEQFLQLMGVVLNR